MVLRRSRPIGLYGYAAHSGRDIAGYEPPPPGRRGFTRPNTGPASKAARFPESALPYFEPRAASRSGSSSSTCQAVTRALVSAAMPITAKASASISGVAPLARAGERASLLPRAAGALTTSRCSLQSFMLLMDYSTEPEMNLLIIK